MISVIPVTQQTDSSCGPAVFQMLLGYLGKKITQNQFIEAAGIQDWIQENGTQPKHMVTAVTNLDPSLNVWFKNKSSVDDLIYLIKEKSWPVAVNWQGLFYNSAEEEPSYPSADSGHYCVVTDVNKEEDTITLLDPYGEFSQKPRVFPLNWFIERWWDIGEEIDNLTQRKKKILTNTLLFLVAPENETFPFSIGMKKQFS